MAILHLLVEMVPFDRSPYNYVENGETHSRSDDVFQRSYQRTAYSVGPPQLSDSPVTLAKSQYSTPNPDLRELLVNDPEGDHSQMLRSRRDVSVANTPARTTVISSSSSIPNGAYSGSISASGGQVYPLVVLSSTAEDGEIEVRISAGPPLDVEYSSSEPVLVPVHSPTTPTNPPPSLVEDYRRTSTSIFSLSLSF
uniref:(California timema) hypothetical protein n=1 Tax=Timema californicum TaxID=61474 RepID=A0A7R9J4D7_TIMCA|nr:unnamed protein product [Timema californicum]